ncbi:protein spaetzle 5 [Culex pipiens pallens]|uniref:protein spaetzle 5 n=1 Tax=Culex pipiens pallens TaxID=42434 RepID=UPI00195442C6|nr:protein spaetzle 5 [Culex pipiens pallens]
MSSTLAPMMLALCVLQQLALASAYQQQKKCGLYGQAPCTFVPAPPGMTPKCASPGKTFCTQNEDYPTPLITNLVEKFGFHRILADEARVEFNAHRSWEEDHHYHHFYGGSYGPPAYRPPPPSSSTHEGYSYDLTKQPTDNTVVSYDRSPVPQPIYIPKPQNSFNFNTYVRAPIVHKQQVQQATGYFYPPPVTQYSPAEWLRRFARDLSERRGQPFQHQPSTRDIRPAPFRLAPELEVRPAPFRPLLNETALRDSLARSRQKRQVTAGRSQLCQTREMYVTPQAALNTKGNWMYVVNHEDSRQLVKAEICSSTECSNLCILPNGYNSRCEQKFSQKRLLTLDSDGQSLYVDTYWFPSCCVCTLANNDSGDQ